MVATSLRIASVGCYRFATERGLGGVTRRDLNLRVEASGVTSDDVR
jgi:hypothetical protein